MESEKNRFRRRAVNIMYEALKQAFSCAFGRPAQCVISAPGRTELGGNHTDHQHGRVLAGAVNLDITAAAARNGLPLIRVCSEGYPKCEISLSPLEPVSTEIGTTAALVRGVAARFAELGCRMQGFDAYVTSRVLPGSGLSSSAAFEVLIACVCNHLLCGGKKSAVELAQSGQYAENVYFGKPCGLMDQTASAVGGIVSIDFAVPEQPAVERIPFDFSACGYALCIIDSGSDHADLTSEYAAVPDELQQVCRCFGKSYLRQVSETEFYARLPEVRACAGDRAVMRAMHVFEENKRVARQVAALRENRFADFLQEVSVSGRSSWMYLQNVIPGGRTQRQELAFALALTEHLLRGRGAFRIHGGGFAGTVQAFVPNALLEEFRDGIDSVLGEGACRVLTISRRGAALLEDCR